VTTTLTTNDDQRPSLLKRIWRRLRSMRFAAVLFALGFAGCAQPVPAPLPIPLVLKPNIVIEPHPPAPHPFIVIQPRPPRPIIVVPEPRPYPR
jgi:hypothetical protein